MTGEEIIQFVKDKGGREITKPMLKQWCAKGLMPHSKKKGKGRAEGFDFNYDEGVEWQALAVDRYMQKWNDANRVLLELWLDGWKIDENHIAQLLRGTLQPFIAGIAGMENIPPAKLLEFSLTMGVKFPIQKVSSKHFAKPEEGLALANAILPLFLKPYSCVDTSELISDTRAISNVISNSIETIRSNSSFSFINFCTSLAGIAPDSLKAVTDSLNESAISLLYNTMNYQKKVLYQATGLSDANKNLNLMGADAWFSGVTPQLLQTVSEVIAPTNASIFIEKLQGNNLVILRSILNILREFADIIRCLELFYGYNFAGLHLIIEIDKALNNKTTYHVSLFWAVGIAALTVNNRAIDQANDLRTHIASIHKSMTPCITHMDLLRNLFGLKGDQGIIQAVEKMTEKEQQDLAIKYSQLPNDIKSAFNTFVSSSSDENVYKKLMTPQERKEGSL